MTTRLPVQYHESGDRCDGEWTFEVSEPPTKRQIELSAVYIQNAFSATESVFP
jgi:hypothetical protein